MWAPPQSTRKPGETGEGRPSHPPSTRAALHGKPHGSARPDGAAVVTAGAVRGALLDVRSAQTRGELRRAIDRAARTLIQEHGGCCPGCGCARDCGPVDDCKTCNDRHTTQRRRREAA